jgi:hypothetical protein
VDLIKASRYMLGGGADERSASWPKVVWAFACTSMHFSEFGSPLACKNILSSQHCTK